MLYLELYNLFCSGFIVLKLMHECCESHCDTSNHFKECLSSHGECHIYSGTLHFFLALNLAAIKESNMHLFGHWLNCNGLISKNGFWLNKSRLDSREVLLFCWLNSRVLLRRNENQPRCSVCFKAIFQSHGGILWNANCCTEIWLLLLHATNCCKDDNKLHHGAQWEGYLLSTVLSFCVLHQSFLWPVICCLLHHCHHH